ncbi:fumarylacetoacetate hydrolase family protein [Spongisporangium articulatum]|uniref:Fumarylacetoacetate hydrolase family protein n=1 Tax=Spongisporangium articulatum TaxID=3362603 RepID=A0ABW8AIH9_9ACTN
MSGFVLYNDFTARDEQWKQTRQGVFGSTGTAKSSASALGTEVVTPDEVLPYLATSSGLEGTVTVNGER